VTINQAEGQPTITVEQMEAAPAGQQATPEQQAAAAQQLRDSEDPNQTPETQEGAAAVEQQATAQQPAAGADLQTQRIVVSELEGMDVVNARGEQLGDVDDVVRAVADNKLYVVIDHGGFLGLGEKQVALSLDGLMIQGNRIVIPGLTDEEIEALPAFESNDQAFPEVEDNEEAEFRVMAQQ
jgi:sporulation protein YlmC with PRC-barrel domain